MNSMLNSYRRRTVQLSRRQKKSAGGNKLSVCVFVRLKSFLISFFIVDAHFCHIIVVFLLLYYYTRFPIVFPIQHRRIPPRMWGLKYILFMLCEYVLNMCVCVWDVNMCVCVCVTSCIWKIFHGISKSKSTESNYKWFFPLGKLWTTKRKKNIKQYVRHYKMHVWFTCTFRVHENMCTYII